MKSNLHDKKSKEMVIRMLSKLESRIKKEIFSKNLENIINK